MESPPRQSSFAYKISKAYGLLHIIAFIWSLALIWIYIGSTPDHLLQPVMVLVSIVPAFLSLYVGLGLWKVKTKSLKLAKILMLMQCVPFATPVLAFSYCSAILLAVGITEGNPSGQLFFGCNFTFGLGETAFPNRVMVNIFAVVSFLLIRRALEIRKSEDASGTSDIANETTDYYDPENLKAD